MTGDELRQAGITLFGKDWVKPMCDAIGISRITLWRYTRKDQIPRPAEIAIRHLLNSHKERRA